MNTPAILNQQNASANAPSLNSEEAFDFSASVDRAATRQSKGVTRERSMLNRQKLIAAVCADYRAHFASIYGKTERLPSTLFDKIESAVDKYIESKLSGVNKGNVISTRRAFYHDGKNMAVTERVINTGENALSLKEQLFGVNIFIGQAEKRLKDLEAKPNPDLDREKQVKEAILRLNVTRQFIQGEIAHQEGLTSKTE